VVTQLQEYLGASWSLKYLLGNYSLKGDYDRKDSSRITNNVLSIDFNPQPPEAVIGSCDLTPIVVSYVESS